MSPEVSPASAVGFKRHLFTLPDEGPAGPIVLALRKLHPAEVMAARGSFASGDSPPAESLDWGRVLLDSDAPLKRVAAMAIIEPEFSFGEAPEEGRAWWGHLSFANKLAIFQESFRLAGLEAVIKSADEEAAQRLARFPAGTPRATLRRKGRKGRKGPR